ncbi:MAG TPA: 16S rRNA (uracil(1498)-N(3))-methyltransferase [Elusimicrobiota bacterium]|nr:16S rRNA (uracil(1498)-N(3))-methyltransferase [Elusimicrobiota bacterium]
MPHFFVPPDQIRENRFFLSEGESRHLSQVLRKAPGDELQLFDGQGGLYRGVIEKVSAGRVEGRLETLSPAVKRPYALRLFQGLPKGDKFEWILEKMTELGAAEIVPVHTERCVAHLSSEKAPARLERWKKIVLSAAKQSGQPQVPEVRPPMSFREALARAGRNGLTLVPWESETDMGLKKVLREQRGRAESVNVFIGPEGGFTADEVSLALQGGAVSVTLGPAILRTETAGLFVASALLYEWGEQTK